MNGPLSTGGKNIVFCTILEAFISITIDHDDLIYVILPVDLNWAKSLNRALVLSFLRSILVNKCL